MRKPPRLPLQQSAKLIVLQENSKIYRRRGRSIFVGRQALYRAKLDLKWKQIARNLHCSGVFTMPMTIKVGANFTRFINHF